MNSLTQPAARPLVSIVINNFNYARFVGQAIKSCLAQTYKHIEVVVVDDGSTDGSASVIRSFGDRVRTVFKANGGQGSAYNAGFAESRGDLVLFLDSDDLLEPEAISEVARLWEPDVSKIHFYLQVVNGLNVERTESTIPSTKLADGDLREQILKTGSYAAPSASGNVYARFALAQILPLPEAEWKIAADTYPIFLAPLLGRIRSCEKVLGLYRVHGKNNEFEVPFNGFKLRRRMNYEVARDRMLKNYCAAHGMPYTSGSLDIEFNHVKGRLASLAVEPHEHPFPADRMGRLAMRLIQATWRDSGAKMAKKLLLSAWTVALVAAPRRWRQKLVDLAFVPSIRPAGLSKSIRTSESHAAVV